MSTKVFVLDPCPVDFPVILTVAHVDTGIRSPTLGFASVAQPRVSTMIFHEVDFEGSDFGMLQSQGL